MKKQGYTSNYLPGIFYTRSCHLSRGTLTKVIQYFMIKPENYWVKLVYIIVWQ